VFCRSAEIGYWLGRAHWGKGIATEALTISTQRAFTTTDIVRLHSGVYAWNPASARVPEKCGYLLEGRMRSAVFKDGQLIDELLYARIKT
jgi:RimJ/RimL family protein N-acetyltransferase